MKKRPNLIYIFADQLCYGRLGYNGDSFARTPNIDALADNCTIMDNCFSGHPVCAPYRASLLTGKYTTSTGMVINEIRMSGQHKTFADVLNDGGCETAYIGKWHMYAAQLGTILIPRILIFQMTAIVSVSMTFSQDITFITGITHLTPIIT